MKWQFGFNPNALYNTEMYPSSTQYHPKPEKTYSHTYSYRSSDIGVGVWLQAMVGIVTMIYMVKFFFLIVVPLVPISVIAYEVMDELLVQKIVIVYGVSFVTAYLLYLCYKAYFFSLSGFIFKSIYIVGIYAFNVWATFFLVKLYPENRALQGLVEEFSVVVIFLKPYVCVLPF